MSMIPRTAFWKLMGGVAALALIAQLGAACGGGGGDDEPGVDAPAGACTVVIASNHIHNPHALAVEPADIMAATDKMYDIQGASMHSHTVMITSAQFGMLSSGGTVMVPSSTGEGHSHMVSISC